MHKSAKYCPIFTILVSIERLQNVSFIYQNIGTFVQPAFLDSPADLENNCLHFNFQTLIGSIYCHYIVLKLVYYTYQSDTNATLYYSFYLKKNDT